MTTTGTQRDMLSELLRRAFASGSLPGVVAAAVDGRGELSVAAAGETQAGSDRPMTADTVLWIASMSKLVVSVAALQLVEEGTLDLDAPLADTLPELRELQVLEGYDESGSPRLRSAREPVTARRLLTHTAGFGYHFFHADVLRYQQENGIPGIIECRTATMTRTPLVHQPGSAWEYGPNVEWVGKAIEAITGRRLEEHLVEKVLSPLGMHRTRFTITPDMRGDLAGMHVRAPDGTLAPIEFEITQEPEFVLAGGGLYSTAADYLRLLTMLVRDGEIDGVRILQPETIEEARRNHIGDLSTRSIASTDPASTNDIDFLPGHGDKWSLLGLLNSSTEPHGRTRGGLEWAGLCNCYFFVDWDRRDAGALFTQILPFADPAVLSLFEEFETSVHQWSDAELS